MLKQQEIENSNRMQRSEIKTKELERENVSLKHEIDMLKTSLSNESIKSKRLEEELHEVQTSYRLTKE